MSRKSGFMQEFKKFILRGNVMDMAVGVIVGGAFTAIVTSLNQDILTPVLAIFGGTDFSNLYVKLGSGDTAPVLMYGNFITAVINFLITAFVIFCLVKFINKLGDTLHHKEETRQHLPRRNAHSVRARSPLMLRDVLIAHPNWTRSKVIEQ